MNRIWDFARFGDAAALLDDQNRSLSYRRLDEEGAALAGAAGERRLVFVLCRNEIGAVLGYTAFVNHGIVPLLLNSHMEGQLLRRLLETYRPAFLWAPEDQAPELEGMRAVFSCHGYALLATDYGREYPLYPDLGLLLTTSGSTGSPKLVRQSYQNILDNATSIASYLALDETERPITTLPMNYTYGLSIINSHLLVGATILLTEKGLMQREFWQFFRQEGATSFGGVPYTYEMLDKLRFDRMKLPSLRTMTQAGGKILPELHEKFARYALETGRRFVVMYGQCEATARMGYLPPERALDKKGSMGIAIPGGQFELIDAQGAPINQPGVTGELVYRGKNVTLGYAESGEDLIRGDERGGILQTGDMAQFDSEGYYTIVGRKKRFLKIYGNRVNLDEVERMIRSAFETDAACAGRDDHMVIFLTPGADGEAVRNYVIEKTRLNPAAFAVKVIDVIPKNDSGKTLYSALTPYVE